MVPGRVADMACPDDLFDVTEVEGSMHGILLDTRTGSYDAHALVVRPTSCLRSRSKREGHQEARGLATQQGFVT